MPCIPSNLQHLPLLLFTIATSLLCFLLPTHSIAVPVHPHAQVLLDWKRSLLSPSDALATWQWQPPDGSPAASNTPHCRWLGVTCAAGGSGDVTAVTLRSLDLQGPLPSNFHSLTSLQTLILTSTNLSGSIPTQLALSRSLVTLDLSSNSLSGPIPPELCSLPNLSSLLLNTNALTGPIPDSIGDLASLQELTLYDNLLAGVVPASIGRLARLRVFRAGGNRGIRGPIPREIGNCTRLEMLGLAETGVSGRIPETIGSLTRIRTIALYTALLSGPIPNEIGNCTGLESLYLYQNSLSGPIPATLGRVRSLKNLLLWQNQLSGSLPPELGRLAGLVMLDLSQNLLTGTIPAELGGLKELKGLQLSANQLTGGIPFELSGCVSLTDLELDNNQLTGEIAGFEFGKLASLTLLHAWQNNLTGSIPASLAQCRGLDSIDLSYNSLSGPVPKEIFSLQNLTKLLLLSNELSGLLPPDVGNCTRLYRFRAGTNRITGVIPPEIGILRELNFLDLSDNRLEGPIPAAISWCENLASLDLHSNGLQGPVPDHLPSGLQFVDFSGNAIAGPLPSGIGELQQLTKLDLGRNRLSGKIPPELGNCGKLQMLDLGDNALSGEIPSELGNLAALGIALNLSCNQLEGSLPAEFSKLAKLAALDLSHNHLSGDLDPLSGLQNLVTLNVSENAFSGALPDTPFFRGLPVSNFAGNRGLYVSGVSGLGSGEFAARPTAMPALKLAMTILIATGAVLVMTAVYLLVRARTGGAGDAGKDIDEVWETTLYQKLDLSVETVLRSLTSANVIGTGSSGVVYKVTLSSGETIAVKKLWSPTRSLTDDDNHCSTSPVASAFRNELAALGTIRHRNIIRLLGWGASGHGGRLLFYSYHPNGNLRTFLQGGGKGSGDWATRYEVVLGLAHAVAYLHHDCVPPVLHGDVKAMNVLLGPGFEPYLADFGLARPVPIGGGGKQGLFGHPASPRVAGSYGYIAPEHASGQRVTEKSDVYSYGVVLLEVLTGRFPQDPSLPRGSHLVEWAQGHIRAGGDPAALLDTRIHSRNEPGMAQEMVQALAVAALCVAARPTDRPSMQDVVALLEEIRRPPADAPKETDVGAGGGSAPPKGATGAVFQGPSCNCSFSMVESSC